MSTGLDYGSAKEFSSVSEESTTPCTFCEVTPVSYSFTIDENEYLTGANAAWAQTFTLLPGGQNPCCYCYTPNGCESGIVAPILPLQSAADGSGSYLVYVLYGCYFDFLSPNVEFEITFGLAGSSTSTLTGISPVTLPSCAFPGEIDNPFYQSGEQNVDIWCPSINSGFFTAIADGIIPASLIHFKANF
ncbi:MAG: hypothetical protein ACLP9L_38920 [Thermoguttaceae bacterium]